MGRSVSPWTAKPPLVLMLLSLRACSTCCSVTSYSSRAAGIDEDLVLLAVAALDEDLGDAGDLEQPRADDPVGQWSAGPSAAARPTGTTTSCDWPAMVRRAPARRRRLVGGLPGDAVRRAPAPRSPGRCRSTGRQTQDAAARRPALDQLGHAARSCRPGRVRRPAGPRWRYMPAMTICPMIDAVGVICGRMPSGSTPAERRQPFLHRLPGGADVGRPVELDVDDVQPGGRLAAHGLHAGGAQQGDLDRLRDERLDFLGGQAGALGDDDDARPVEVGKDVDRQRRRQVAAVDQQRQAERRRSAAGSAARSG